jgi:hypothetical protein
MFLQEVEDRFGPLPDPPEPLRPVADAEPHCQITREYWGFRKLLEMLVDD